MTVIARLAPTPSGFLHAGNAVNFLLTWVLTRAHGGRLRLRIDDVDSARSRPEYVEDIFRQLEWLGIDWDDGPTGPDDFSRHHSQKLRLERYRLGLGALGQSGRLFSCRCSRQEITRRSATGLYPGTCRHRPLPAATDETIRVRIETGTNIPINGHTVALDQAMGDFVVWRRDDTPSYQLASLLDDLDHRITLIVRGSDLLESTAAQMHLATLLGADAFLACRFHHHPLLFGGQGKKLSKSDGALSLCHLREKNTTPADLCQQAAAMLGIDPKNRTPIRTSGELLSMAIIDAHRGCGPLSSCLVDHPPPPPGRGSKKNRPESRTGMKKTA